MIESDLQSENHNAHPLEWRSDSTCLLCLLEIISSEACHRLKIHRRFALATLSRRLCPEPVIVSSSCLVQSRSQPNQNKSLPRLLQKNHSIASRVLDALLDALTVPDLVDLAVEAVYRLYNYVIREESILGSVLSHCIKKIAADWTQPEKWIPYLGVIQRLARIAVSSVALAIGQEGKLEELMVERLGEQSELIALHLVSVLDPVLKSNDAPGWMRTSKRYRLMFQLARLLLKADSPQLQCAVLDLSLFLWTRVELTDDDNAQQVLVANVNGIKRVLVQSLPDMQVAALQVLDVMLWKCWQSADGVRWSKFLIEQHDLADVLYDLLYGNHLPCLEYSLRCLQHLSRCPAFFQRRNIILGVEPLIRVIPHLVTTQGIALGGGLVVAYAVHLLSEMLARYDGAESLLERISLADGPNRTTSGFEWASEIAAMAVRSCVLHLETGGARLVAALLERKNAPVPLPVVRIAELVVCCVRHLAADQKKWRSETGRHHLQAVVRVLSSVTALVVEATKEPRLLLSSYAGRPATKRRSATETDEPVGDDEAADEAVDARAEEELTAIIDLILATVEKLISAFHEIDETSEDGSDAPLCVEDDVLWCQWLELLGRLACGLRARGSPFIDRILTERNLLARCFEWRARRGPSVRESVDDLLTWFLDRRLGHQQPGRYLAGSNPIVALRGLVRLIPSDPTDWGRWLSSSCSTVQDNQRPPAPYGAKCACIVLLYYVELRKRSTNGDGVPADHFAGRNGKSILAGLGSLMLTRSPVDLDDPDVLRAIWFLAALYSGDPGHRTEAEVSNAFVHLVEWFQPNRSLLPHWLHRIYTPDPIILRWTFAHKERVRCLGNSLLVVWLADGGSDADGERAETLIKLCLTERPPAGPRRQGDVGRFDVVDISEDSGNNKNGGSSSSSTSRDSDPSDDDDLLAVIFELVFHDRSDVSSCAAAIVERVIRSDRAAARLVTRLIRSSVPRLMRFTGSSGGGAGGPSVDSPTDARVVGSLRLLCRLPDCAGDPTIVVALASYLSRSVRTQQLASEQQPEQQIEIPVTLTLLDLWSLGCRFLTSALADPASSSVVGPLLLENEPFVDFVGAIFSREDLPIWRDAAALLAALASVRPRKVARTVSVSTESLVRRLTSALVGHDADADELDSSPRVLLDLLSALLSTDFGHPAGSGVLIDPSAWPVRSACREKSLPLLQHLWCAVVNWSVREAPPDAGAVHRCLAHWVRFVRRHMSRFDPLALNLAVQPWLLFSLNSSTNAPPSALELLDEIVQLASETRHPHDIMRSSFDACYEQLKTSLSLTTSNSPSAAVLENTSA